MYISSTFRDLKDHRESVMKIFYNFPDKFDLFAMENYVAEDITPLDRCLRDVEQCDIYILLLANRYGFIPEGQEKSITELEYLTAKKCGKQVLVFLADDTRNFPADTDEQAEVKKAKLAAFKKNVSAANLTHPEPFISPESLAIQVSESLMKKMFLEFKVPDKRKLCCDRRPQFSQYLESRSKSQVKVFLIHGQRKELGKNLINRFLYFTLNTGIEGRLTYHLPTDFILGDYESSKTSLIVNILSEDLNQRDIADPALSYLIKAIDERPYPNMVIVLECSTAFLRPEDVAVMRQFFTEFHEAYEASGKKEVYFFLNIEDNHEDETVIGETIQAFLSANQPGDPFLYCLKRLKKENYQVLEQWISAYITGDESCMQQLMDKYFAALVEAKLFTMADAELSLQKLLKKIDARDSEVLEILNL